MRFPEVVAQGGNAAEYPENTLPAVRSALELGARFVHIDTQLTRDRQVVLLRDASLLRTAGVDRCALEMSRAELADIAVNEAARFGARYTDVGVPTLAQMVELLVVHPQASAFVELQSASVQAVGVESFVAAVCELIQPVARQCVIVSRDLAALNRVRQRYALRVGWVLVEYSTLAALKCEAFAPDYMLAHHELTTDRERLWRGPWRWVLTHVETRSAALSAAARGARLIATPHVRRLLREYRAARPEIRG